MGGSFGLNDLEGPFRLRMADFTMPQGYMVYNGFLNGERDLDLGTQSPKHQAVTSLSQK